MNALRTNRIVSILAALSIGTTVAHAKNSAQSPAPDLLESIGGRAGVKAAQDQVTMRAGIELNAPEVRFVWRKGKRLYWRTMQMSTFDGFFLLRVVLLEDGRIAGIGMGPASGAPPVDRGGAPLKKP